MNENNGISRIALFIDADNLFIGASKASFPVDITRILTAIREDGIISLARAYADWSIYPARDYIPAMRHSAVEMIMLPTDARQKNTADIQMVVDALEITILPNSPDVIALVAGDRDFVPVIQRVKRYGKTVIGMGLRGSTNRALEAVCTKFIYYDDLFPREQEDSIENQASRPIAIQQDANPQSKKLAEAIRLLIQTVKLLQKQNNEPSGARVGGLIRQLDPTFDYIQLGFSSFKGFVAGVEKQGFVEIVPCKENYLDFSVLVIKEPGAVLESIAANKLRFDSQENILQSYRMILENKRIPIMSWKERKFLVTKLYDQMTGEHNIMEKWQIEEYLEEVSEENNLKLPWNAISKLVLTLFIARTLQPILTSEGTSPNYLERNTKLHFVCTLPVVFLRIHSTYLRGITLAVPDTPLNREAIALLLFESDNELALKKVDDVLEMYHKLNGPVTMTDKSPNSKERGVFLRLLISFFDQHIPTEQNFSKGKIIANFKKHVIENGKVIPSDEATNAILKCIEMRILQQTKEGEVFVYNLNPEWRGIIRDLKV